MHNNPVSNNFVSNNFVSCLFLLIFTQKKSSKMNNPFVFGSATADEWFTDREADAQRLLANFTHGINTILISARRWGKTSLVQKVSKMANSDKIKVVNIDIFSCRNEYEFYTLFATEIIKQTANKWQEWAENVKRFLSGIVPKISFGADPLNDFELSFDFSNKELFNDALELPEKIAREKGIHIVVCIDEFQQLAEIDNAQHFQRKLRSVWQLQKHVSYCLYGSKKHVMTKIFSKQSMPFYRFGDVIYLQKIATPDWVSYICKRFDVTGKEISTELAQRICATVENHSSYVQQLSWLVWIRTTKVATAMDFETATEDLLNQNSMLYYKYVDGLTAYQLNFLQAISDGVHSEFSTQEHLKKYQLGTSANITRLKTALENKELIDISGKTVSFNDPVFKLWFKKNVKRFS